MCRECYSNYGNDQRKNSGKECKLWGNTGFMLGGRIATNAIRLPAPNAVNKQLARLPKRVECEVVA